MTARLLMVLLLLTCVGCLTDNKTERGDSAPNRGFERRLLTIAQSYESFALADAKARWAPTSCAPNTVDPFKQHGDLHFSESDDSQTHGRKLYILFAKHMKSGASYIEDGKPNPIGQVIVKEAWVPEELNDDGKPLPSITRNGKKVVPYARKDGKLYHAKERASLFVMFKLDPKTPDTDEGWVYGTVSPDGKTVTSAGKVESCMKCHQKAPHDRLFGLPGG